MHKNRRMRMWWFFGCRDAEVRRELARERGNAQEDLGLTPIKPRSSGFAANLRKPQFSLS